MYESVQEREMIDPELLETLKTASVNDRIALIEAILRSLKQAIRASSRQSIAESRPLQGKVSRYDDPYEPIAAEDNDPADQIIVATAKVYNAPLLTQDQKILDYADVETFP